MAVKAANRVASTNGSGKPVEAGIIIEPLMIGELIVPIIGVTPLIVHCWSEKAIKQMLDKQTKKAQKGKEAKDPEADYRGSLYVSEDGWTGVPAVAFKAAFVGACRSVDGFPMTLAKRTFFVRGQGRDAKCGQDLVRVYGEHRSRRDMVRLESGVADVRFRAEYPEWKAVLRIEFNAGVISKEQVANLVSVAGWSEGVCEWRPSAPKSCTGTCGRWRIYEGDASKWDEETK